MENEQQAGRGRKPKRHVVFPLEVALLAATTEGDVDEVRALLNKGADPNAGNHDGLRPLHQAAMDNRLDLITLLLDAGANVDVPDNEAWTPLHGAASNGQIDACRVLLDRGADLAALNVDNETPMDCADAASVDEPIRTKLLALFRSVAAARGVSMAAVAEIKSRQRLQLLEHAQQIVRSGAEEGELNARGERGATMLHVATCHGYNDVVEYLLNNGADVDVKDDSGMTPLHAAVVWGNVDAVLSLVSAGADINARTEIGEALLDLVHEDDIKMRTLVSSLSTKARSLRASFRKRPDTRRIHPAGPRQADTSASPSPATDQDDDSSGGTTAILPADTLATSNSGGDTNAHSRDGDKAKDTGSADVTGAGDGDGGIARGAATKTVTTFESAADPKSTSQRIATRTTTTTVAATATHGVGRGADGRFQGAGNRQAAVTETTTAPQHTAAAPNTTINNATTIATATTSASKQPSATTHDRPVSPTHNKNGRSNAKENSATGTTSVVTSTGESSKSSTSSASSPATSQRPQPARTLSLAAAAAPNTTFKSAASTIPDASKDSAMQERSTSESSNSHAATHTANVVMTPPRPRELSDRERERSPSPHRMELSPPPTGRDTPLSARAEAQLRKMSKEVQEVLTSNTGPAPRRRYITRSQHQDKRELSTHDRWQERQRLSSVTARKTASPLLERTEFELLQQQHRKNSFAGTSDGSASDSDMQPAAQTNVTARAPELAAEPSLAKTRPSGLSGPQAQKQEERETATSNVLGHTPEPEKGGPSAHTSDAAVGVQSEAVTAEANDDSNGGSNGGSNVALAERLTAENEQYRKQLTEAQQQLREVHSAFEAYKGAVEDRERRLDLIFASTKALLGTEVFASKGMGSTLSDLALRVESQQRLHDDSLREIEDLKQQLGDATQENRLLRERLEQLSCQPGAAATARATTTTPQRGSSSKGVGKDAKPPSSSTTTTPRKAARSTRGGRGGKSPPRTGSTGKTRSRSSSPKRSPSRNTKGGAQPAAGTGQRRGRSPSPSSAQTTASPRKRSARTRSSSLQASPPSAASSLSSSRTRTSDDGATASSRLRKIYEATTPSRTGSGRSNVSAASSTSSTNAASSSASRSSSGLSSGPGAGGVGRSAVVRSRASAASLKARAAPSPSRVRRGTSRTANGSSSGGSGGGRRVGGLRSEAVGSRPRAPAHMKRSHKHLQSSTIMQRSTTH